jgi:chromosome segregation ATPase
MTDPSAIIDLLERQLDGHTQKMREASKIISNLRRQASQDNEVIASLAAQVQARETTYRAIVEEIRKIMGPLSETSDPEKIAALRGHWKEIETTLDEFLEVGEPERN